MPCDVRESLYGRLTLYLGKLSYLITKLDNHHDCFGDPMEKDCIQKNQKVVKIIHSNYIRIKILEDVWLYGNRVRQLRNPFRDKKFQQTVLQVVFKIHCYLVVEVDALLAPHVVLCLRVREEVNLDIVIDAFLYEAQAVLP